MKGTAYLLLDEHGAPLGVAETLDEALTEARRLDPQERIYLDAPTELDYELVDPEASSCDLAANARVSDANAPQAALREVRKALKRPEGSVIDFAAAMSMSLEEAWEQINAFFPRNKFTKKTKTRKSVRAYEKPLGNSNRKGMAYYILAQNYKTAKKTPKAITTPLFEATGYRKASVRALSLLPSTQVFRNPTVLKIMNDAPRLYGVGEVHPVCLNACARASAECASSCLVFSGRNLADDYNTVKKYALTEAFVHHPEAFVRMLIEGIRLHRATSFNTGTMPLVRLNVFSDLPWELMIPELFDEFDDVQFYDYTKIPNRQPPPNYDLTFSFSGTPKNALAIDDEIGVWGRRIAIVFAATGLRLLYRVRWKEGQRWKEIVAPRTEAEATAREHGVEVDPLGQLEIPQTPAFYRRKPGAARRTRHLAKLPEDFLGLEVIDGDVSDMRPYDPAPSIVGLRWKNPANQGVTLEQAKLFIVQVELVPRAGGYYDAIVSKTPRFDDFDYAEYAPSVVDE